MSPRIHLLNICFVLVIAAGPVASFGAGEPLALRVEESSIVVSGATPNSEVTLFGVGQEQGEYFKTLIRRDHVLAVDREGAGRWQVPGGVPRKSVWFVVDSVKGEHAAASPAGYPLRRLPRPMHFVTPGEGANRDLLRIEATYAEVLIVRHGHAWIESASKGGSADVGRNARALFLDVGALKKLRGGDSLDRLKPGDVVVSVDPYSLAFFAETVVAR